MKIDRLFFASSTLVASLCLGSSPHRIEAAPLEWAEFRGPAQGTSPTTHLPDKWSPTENIRWKTEVSGRGWSSPVSDGQHIYLTTAVTNAASDNVVLQVHAYDLKNGKRIWQTDALLPDPSDIPRGHQKNTDASPTPIVRDGVIYAHFGHLGTAAVTRDGKVKWRQTSLKYSPVHGNGGSPVIAGDVLVFSCDAKSEPLVAGLDLKTGDVRWKTPRNTSAKRTFSFATPALYQRNGKTEIILPGSGFVGGYDPALGTELWRVRYGEGYSLVPRPVIADGHVYVTTGFDKSSVMAVRLDGLKGDSTETHVDWTISKGGPHTPSLVVSGQKVFFVSDAGIATCADAKTGAIHWSERLGGDFSSSPLLADGRLYFFNEAGTAVLVSPETTFRILGKNDLGDRVFASPAVVDGTLIVRSENYLWRIGSTH